jgi:hypothetical protein
MMIFYVPCF